MTGIARKVRIVGQKLQVLSCNINVLTVGGGAGGNQFNVASIYQNDFFVWQATLCTPNDTPDMKILFQDRTDSFYPQRAVLRLSRGGSRTATGLRRI